MDSTCPYTAVILVAETLRPSMVKPVAFKTLDTMFQKLGIVP